MEDDKYFQIKFFLKILNTRKKREVVNEITTLLNLKPDQVYRLIRGNTSLRSTQLYCLAKHYKISIDSLIFEDTDIIQFKQDVLPLEWDELRDFFKGVHQQLRATPSKDINLKNPFATVYYASAELPFLFQVLSPELMKFKLYIWMRTSSSNNSFGKAPFNPNDFPEELSVAIGNLWNLYFMVPSVEFWNDSLFINTLNQIENLLKIRQFAESSYALDLLKELERLFNHSLTMAKYGKKFPIGIKEPQNYHSSFQLYYNQIIHNTNTLLVDYVGATIPKVTYLSFNTPNFLSTTNPVFCEYTTTWFEQLKEQSTLISESGALNRSIFTQRIKDKLARAKQRIKLEMERQKTFI